FRWFLGFGVGFRLRFLGSFRLFRVFFVVLVSHQSRPPCERKVRVGANSPSLWPTIDSEMKTGTCFLPSCTAIVWPTISGKTVEVRDQVFTICFWPDSFIAAIRLISAASTQGPFLVERPIR